MAEQPQLSIVLPTLGNYEVLAKVLDGYERQDAPAGSYELIVVTDQKDPDPAAVDALATGRPYAVRRLTGRRPGASANRNTGWEAARGSVVMFTDDDTIPVRRLVSEHLASHAEHPQGEVAVAGHVRWARGIEVTPFMKWLDYGIQFDYASLKGDQGSWAHLYSANSSIKRSFLETVGGYDEERLPYGYEDLDWGYRAREHGLQVIYNRHAVVEHWRPMTVEHWKVRAARLAVSEWQFCQMHPDVPPWFWRLFSEAASYPVGRGRARRLAALVPRWVPGLGPAVWDRASIQWRQEIAPYFLAAWEQAQAEGVDALRPDLDAVMAERSAPGDTGSG